MAVTKISCAVLGAAFTLTGCARSAAVIVVEAPGVYEVGRSDSRIVFTTGRPIDRYIHLDAERTAQGVVFICGQKERYLDIVDLSPVRTSRPGTYGVTLRPMSERTFWKPDGEVTRGWPADLARQSGICFRVEASEMLWRTLESDTVVLPR